MRIARACHVKCLAVFLLLLLAVSAWAGPRSSAVRHAFMRQTGYPHGRPGFVIDHVVPLCAGGLDAVSNLQWQTKAAAKVKDRDERALCRRLHPRARP